MSVEMLCSFRKSLKGDWDIAYLSARLYKKSRAVRLSLVAVPLVLNLALYAYYRTTPFFYMAIVLFICIPFAWTQRKSQ